MAFLSPEQIQHNLVQMEEVFPKKGRVLIIPHNYPDPDALASSAAMELLLAKRFGLHGQIAFTGPVSRAENREFLRHFRYKWRFLAQVREPRRGKIPCIFVDTAPWSGNVTTPRYGRPMAVFDHHPFATKTAKWDGVFKDIRPGSGASASMMYEYLKACGIVIPKWLSTLMAYAIATETMDLSLNSTALDLQAYHDLLGRANMSVLGSIRHAPLPRSYYALLQQAMQNASVYGHAAWSHLESVQQPEIVSEIADLLLRAERISWSFCTAYHQDSLLISLRSSQRGSHCGSLIKHVVGALGSAGGHNRMAAGNVDMKGVPPDQREQQRRQLVKDLLARIVRRLSQVAGPLDTMARPLIGESL